MEEEIPKGSSPHVLCNSSIMKMLGNLQENIGAGDFLERL